MKVTSINIGYYSRKMKNTRYQAVASAFRTDEAASKFGREILNVVNAWSQFVFYFKTYVVLQESLASSFVKYQKLPTNDKWALEKRTDRKQCMNGQMQPPANIGYLLFPQQKAPCSGFYAFSPWIAEIVSVKYQH